MARYCGADGVDVVFKLCTLSHENTPDRHRLRIAIRMLNTEKPTAAVNTRQRKNNVQGIVSS